MTIDKELLEILACPETKEPVRLADEALVGRLNAAIREGKIKDRKGEVVGEEMEAGLLREDGKVVYPVRDEIPIMLIPESIEIDQLEG